MKEVEQKVPDETAAKFKNGWCGVVDYMIAATFEQ